MSESASRGSQATPSPKIDPKEMALRIARGQPPAKIRRRTGEGHDEGWRETVESVVVAFVLAFLFRTFVAEAFVIPTGSMAPTLVGRHKDVDCAQCGTQFRIGASDEVDRDNGLYRRDGRVEYGFCPNCNYRNDIFDAPVFKGDRILVNKFPYEFSDPEPWDVVVFKFPVDPKTNYIKRLIGLPGETITIEWGDIYRRAGADGVTEILRKPPEKQQALQMLVYNNDKPARTLLEQGWPERWAPMTLEGDRWSEIPSAWVPDPEARTFSLSAKDSAGEQAHWLRYRHLIPTVDDWERALQKQPPLGNPEPLLISDYYAYNSGYLRDRTVKAQIRDMLGEHWVGDLTVQFELEVGAAQGELLLELVESTRRYHCRIDLSTGKATLSFQDDVYPGQGGRSTEDVVLDEAITSISRPGTYKVAFANVDDRLTLWVDGDVVPFETKGEYRLPPRTAFRAPTTQDLIPVGIGARGADLKISHLLLERDIYYTSKDDIYDVDRRRALLRDPEKYGDYAAKLDPLTFELGDDEFLVLGDNSPRSADSRLWDNPDAIRPYAVPRELLIGKAFFVYWPHGVPFLNGGKGYAPSIGPLKPIFYHRGWDPDTGREYISDYPSLQIPFYPQISRMNFIR